MMSPAIQPSNAPPAQTSTRKRSSSAIRIALPAMISGTLVARPKMISVVLMRRGVRQIDPRRRALGRRRNRDDVVEAHHDVGDGDDAHRAPERFARLRRRHRRRRRPRSTSLIATQNSSSAADELEVRHSSSPAR